MNCTVCGADNRTNIAFCEECGDRLPAAASLSAGVDLNYASVEEVRATTGVHGNAAKAIVEFRQRYGPFTQMRNVERVTGVGPKNMGRSRYGR